MQNLLMDAVKNQDYNSVVEIYNKTPSLLNLIDENGRNSVMYSEGDILNFLITRPKCDIFLLDRTGKSLLDILLEKGIKVNKMKLLKSSRTTLKTTNIPSISSVILDKLHRDIILYDDLERFIEEFEYYGDYILLIACQFNAISIANYLVDINYGIDYCNSSRFIPLCYTFYYDNEELSSKIYKAMSKKENALIKNVYNEMSINYGSKCIDLKDMILHFSNNLIITPSLESKTFRMINFKIINYIKSLEFGISGSIIHVQEKSTCNDFILKKIELKNGEITPSIFQEINLHKFVNKLDSSLAVNFYGYFVDNGSIYMVLEYMTCTLNYYFNLIKESKEKLNNRLKNIFYELLLLVHRLGSLGIIHRDLKTNNIMIDRFGKLKIIDFGLSQFIGLSMSNELANSIILPTFIYPPDRIGSINLIIENKTQITVHTNRKTLNVDIFAIAVNLLNVLIDKSITAISDGNTIYITNTRTGAYLSENQWYPLSHDLLSDYNDHFELYDILKSMLNSNSMFRLFADQCLKHRYFLSFNEEINDHCILDNKEQKFISNENKSSLVQYINNIHMEVRYKDEMISNLKSLNLLNTNNENDVIDDEYIESIIFILNMYKRSHSTSFDVLINFISKFHRLISYITVSDNTKKGVYLAHAIILYIITDIQFEDIVTLRGDTVLNRANILASGRFTISQLKIALDSVLSFDSLFVFIPVQTMITYITIKIRELGYQTRNMEIQVSSILLKYTVFMDYNETTVWNLLSNLFHYLLPGNHYSFIDHVNDDLISDIDMVVKSYTDIDDYDLRSLLV